MTGRSAERREVKQEKLAIAEIQLSYLREAVLHSQVKLVKDRIRVSCSVFLHAIVEELIEEIKRVDVVILLLP